MSRECVINTATRLSVAGGQGIPNVSNVKTSNLMGFVWNPVLKKTASIKEQDRKLESAFGVTLSVPDVKER